MCRQRTHMMLYYNIQMSEAVEPASVQGESDVESILSGSESNLSEIDDDAKSQSKSPISEIEDNTD